MTCKTFLPIRNCLTAQADRCNRNRWPRLLERTGVKLVLLTMLLIALPLSNRQCFGQESEIKEIFKDQTAELNVPSRIRLLESVGANRVIKVESLDHCGGLLGDNWSSIVADELDFERDVLMLIVWELTGDHPDYWSIESSWTTDEDGNEKLSFHHRRDPNAPYEAINLASIGVSLFIAPKVIEFEERLKR